MVWTPAALQGMSPLFGKEEKNTVNVLWQKNHFTLEIFPEGKEYELGFEGGQQLKKTFYEGK